MGEEEWPEGKSYHVRRYATGHAYGNYELGAARHDRQCLNGRVEADEKVYIQTNHYALSWDPRGTNFVGPANVRKEIVLDRSHGQLFEISFREAPPMTSELFISEGKRHHRVVFLRLRFD